MSDFVGVCYHSNLLELEVNAAMSIFCVVHTVNYGAILDKILQSF